MIDINFVRNNKQEALKRLSVRGLKVEETVDKALSLDDTRRRIQSELNEKQAELNKRSKEIGELFKKGEKEAAENAKQETSELKKKTSELKEELDRAEKDLEQVLYHIPNVPHPKVPQGSTDDDNELIEQEDGVPEPMEGGKPHWELGKEFGLIDLEAGVKITGAGFPVLRGKAAKYQRALISYFLDEALKRGYNEVIPPLLVNEDSGTATGQLPDKEGQMYHIPNEDLYLIPTAEVPITNLYRDEIVSSSSLPLKLTGYTPCFRREAGSYGKDVRGLNRLHQFDKVEVVRIDHPDNSYDSLWEMVEHVKELLQDLGLPYRVLRLCGGDLGYAAAMTYDLEVFSKAQQKWLEVSSVSNFETYQANRLKLRIKDENGQKITAHTLNGSAIALARLFAALLENYQDKDRILIPEVLIPYTGFKSIEKNETP